MQQPVLKQQIWLLFFVWQSCLSRQALGTQMHPSVTTGRVYWHQSRYSNYVLRGSIWDHEFLCSTPRLNWVTFRPGPRSRHNRAMFHSWWPQNENQRIPRYVKCLVLALFLLQHRLTSLAKVIVGLQKVYSAPGRKRRQHSQSLGRCSRYRTNWPH